MASLSTEMTATHDRQVPANWVLYDAACTHCSALARRARTMLHRRGFLVAPLQSLWVPSALGMGPREVLKEMRVFTADGEHYGGADAVLYLARRIWWAWPLWALSKAPGMRGMLRSLYRWIAAHRHCSATSCSST